MIAKLGASQLFQAIAYPDCYSESIVRCELAAISRPLPKKKIKTAAKLHAIGWSLNEIAEALDVATRTVSGWKRTDEWQAESRKLATTEGRAATTLLLDYRKSYVQEMLASRDIMRQTLNAQMKVAGQLAIAASKGADEIRNTSETPTEMVLMLSKGGACHVAQTSAMVAKTAQALLDGIYAITRVIEHIGEDDNADHSQAP